MHRGADVDEMPCASQRMKPVAIFWSVVATPLSIVLPGAKNASSAIDSAGRQVQLRVAAEGELQALAQRG